ncbi:hypothetical protein ABFY60_00595 [Lysinibacillus pakistanensis]|uniref:hypothetical protein n=1 Tax=Lysinibacillus pakistanensis TaxID=759811 RepID=UPI003D2C12AA
MTAIHGQTATTTTKTVTVSAKTVASDITIGALYNKDGKHLVKDVNLAKDKFYLPVTVKDQYGKEITDLNRLNGANSEVLVTNTNKLLRHSVRLKTNYRWKRCNRITCYKHRSSW